MGTAYYCIIATKTDPSDPTIALESRCKDSNIPFDSDRYEYHCQICDSHVLGGSKHCGQCNRCTSGFDHHCRYLNNCIGEQNYDYFFKLIIWVFWMCLLHNITNVFVLYDLFTGRKETKEQHIEFYDRVLTSEFQICLIIMIVFNLLALMFLVNLIKFHIELKHKGLTTYEFLKMKENISGKGHTSKIVIKVDKELREQMRQDELERIALKREQAALRVKLERAAMNGGVEEEPDSKALAPCEADPKAEIGLRKEQDNLHSGDTGIQEARNEKEKDDMVMELNSPVNANTMIMNQSEMENGINNQGSAVVMTDERKSQLAHLESVSDSRPSTMHIISKLFPCCNRCIKKNSQIVQENDKLSATESEQNRRSIIQNGMDNLGDIQSDQKMGGSIKKNVDDLAPYLQCSDGTIPNSRNQKMRTQDPNGYDLGDTNRIVLKSLTKNGSSPDVFEQHGKIDIHNSIIQSNGSRENISSCSEKQINDIIDFENKVKHDKKMYKVLKLGTGGDNQDHVSTPTSLKERSEDGTPKISNKFGMARAVSANIYQNQFNKARQSQSYVARPNSTYSQKAQTLKRIKSELETIQERKEDKDQDGIIGQQIAQNTNQMAIEQIMVDESYSFSLRQFEKQNSKRDLGQVSLGGGNPIGDQSRLSNMSAYGQLQGAGDGSHRAVFNPSQNPSAAATDSRKVTTKALMISQEYGPFSKPRRERGNQEKTGKQQTHSSMQNFNTMNNKLMRTQVQGSDIENMAQINQQVDALNPIMDQDQMAYNVENIDQSQSMQDNNFNGGNKFSSHGAQGNHIVDFAESLKDDLDKDVQDNAPSQYPSVSLQNDQSIPQSNDYDQWK